MSDTDETKSTHRYLLTTTVQAIVDGRTDDKIIICLDLEDPEPTIGKMLLHSNIRCITYKDICTLDAYSFKWMSSHPLNEVNWKSFDHLMYHIDYWVEHYSNLQAAIDLRNNRIELNSIEHTARSNLSDLLRHMSDSRKLIRQFIFNQEIGIYVDVSKYSKL